MRRCDRALTGMTDRDLFWQRRNPEDFPAPLLLDRALGLFGAFELDRGADRGIRRIPAHAISARIRVFPVAPIRIIPAIELTALRMTRHASIAVNAGPDAVLGREAFDAAACG